MTELLPPLTLACDPGYDRLGWAVGHMNPSKKLVVAAFGCLTTSKKAPLLDRFQDLFKQLTQIATQHAISNLAIETLYFSKNQSTALAVSEVRGVLFGLAFQHGWSITQYTPAEIKLAVTGFGRADKTAVRKMVELQLKITIPTQEVDDTLDALALLLTHYTTQRQVVGR